MTAKHILFFLAYLFLGSYLRGQAHLGSSEDDYKKLGLTHSIAVWEDGMRTTGKSNTYEWWYVDALLEDSTKIVIVFFTKPILQTKRGLRPEVNVDILFKDGRRVVKNCVVKPDEASFSKEKCAVKIGKNAITGDLNTYKIELDMEGIKGELVLKGEVPAWRPETGHIYYGKKKEYYFAWLPSVPKGKLSGNLTIDGKELAVKGSGYHDHNWGNKFMGNLINHWYWARVDIEGYTLIASEITDEKKYGNQVHKIFMVAKDGKILADNTDNLQIKRSQRITNKHTDKPVDNEISFIYKDSEKEYHLKLEGEKTIVQLRSDEVLLGIKRKLAKLLGINGGYHRFLGKASLQVKEHNRSNSYVSEALWELMYFGKPMND